MLGPKQLMIEQIALRKANEIADKDNRRSFTTAPVKGFSLYGIN